MKGEGEKGERRKEGGERREERGGRGTTFLLEYDLQETVHRYRVGRIMCSIIGVNERTGAEGSPPLSLSLLSGTDCKNGGEKRKKVRGRRRKMGEGRGERGGEGKE